jgi:hypothetical protein
MKLLRPLADYTLSDHKANDSIRRELQITCILDKIDEYGLNWLLHLQRMPQNRIPFNITTTDHKEEEQLEGRRNVGESNCNSGDGTDQRVKSLMFMMTIIILSSLTTEHNFSRYCGAHAQRLFYQYILCSKFSKRNNFLLKLQGP